MMNKEQLYQEYLQASIAIIQAQKKIKILHMNTQERYFKAINKELTQNLKRLKQGWDLANK